MCVVMPHHARRSTDTVGRIRRHRRLIQKPHWNRDLTLKKKPFPQTRVVEFSIFIIVFVLHCYKLAITVEKKKKKS